MRYYVLTAALGATLLVTACANNQEGGTAIGAMVGGIIGNEIGRSLDQRDRELARQAEFDAWERGAPRQPVRWRNPDNGRYGEIIVEDYHYRSGAQCRDFVHRVWIDGRPQAMRGTACRNPDGTWTQV